MILVEDFNFGYEGATRAMLQYLDSLITQYPNVTSKIRYKIPFYFRKSWVCYLNPRKDGAVELAFPRGNELMDEGGLLEAKDRKQVRSVTFKTLDDIDDLAIQQALNEAFLLDDHVSYASKRI